MSTGRISTSLLENRPTIKNLSDNIMIDGSIINHPGYRLIKASNTIQPESITLAIVKVKSEQVNEAEIIRHLTGTIREYGNLHFDENISKDDVSYALLEEFAKQLARGGNILRTTMGDEKTEKLIYGAGIYFNDLNRRLIEKKFSDDNRKKLLKANQVNSVFQYKSIKLLLEIPVIEEYLKNNIDELVNEIENNSLTIPVILKKMEKQRQIIYEHILKELQKERENVDFVLYIMKQINLTSFVKSSLDVEWLFKHILPENNRSHFLIALFGETLPPGVNTIARFISLLQTLKIKERFAYIKRVINKTSLLNMLHTSTIKLSSLIIFIAPEERFIFLSTYIDKEFIIEATLNQNKKFIAEIFPELLEKDKSKFYLMIKEIIESEALNISKKALEEIKELIVKTPFHVTTYFGIGGAEINGVLVPTHVKKQWEAINDGQKDLIERLQEVERLSREADKEEPSYKSKLFRYTTDHYKKCIKICEAANEKIQFLENTDTHIRQNNIITPA